jgi:insertion element IS1 protein InsB
MFALVCPACGSTHIKRNGHTHTGKQNHAGKKCGREFVQAPTHGPLSAEQKELVKRLLLERVPLRGICRVLKISLTWLLEFIATVYAEAPDDLNVRLEAVATSAQVHLYRIEAQADELWSFVGSKANPQWVWLALDVQTRQIVAFHVGDRSRASARALWAKIPAAYRQHAHFSTDEWEAYQGVIPPAQHQAVSKQTGQTALIERFNCTLRQRVSRLVRKTLSFSKKVQNHIGAIKYFICHYNAALLV